MKSNDNRTIYKKIEGLNQFLFSLNPVLESLELNDRQISVYVNTNCSELYIRIWMGFNASQTYFSGLVYCSKYSFVIKELNNIFVNGILREGDELEIYFSHLKKDKEVISKITVTQSGEVILDKKRLEVWDGALTKVLSNLSLNHNIIARHPNYHELADELEEELNYNPLFKDLHYDYDDEKTLGGTSPEAFSFLGQKLRQEFEASQQLWISSGMLTDQIYKPNYGLTMSYQYFIAFKLKGQLQFFLSSKMRAIFIKKTTWLSDTNWSIKFTGDKFSFEDYEAEEFLEWIETTGQHYLTSTNIKLTKTGIKVSDKT